MIFHFMISALIAFDTEYHDPEMFISDQSKPDIRRDMNGSSMMPALRSGQRPALRNIKSYQGTPHYESIDIGDPAIPTRGVK